MPWPKGRPRPTRGTRRPDTGSRRTTFRPGHRPWNAGTKGQGLTGPNRGSFGGPINHPGGKPPAPIGARRWNRKGNEVDVKVPAPSRYAGRYGWKRASFESWRPERLVNFEAVHGPVGRGLQVRALLPLCTCEPNLVLITPAVGGILNKGIWTRPRKPWRSLPLDAEARLSAVIAAIAFTRAMERRRTLTRPCACGCGEPVKTHGNYNQSAQNNRFRPGHHRRLA